VENECWVETHSQENMDPETKKYGTFHSPYRKERENPSFFSIIPMNYSITHA